MSLLLIELSPTETDRDAVRQLIEQVGQAVAADSGALIEAQITDDGVKAFVVVEHTDAAAVSAALDEAGVAADSVEPVRLVGDDIERLKNNRPAGEYLVEWDLPAGLTMEQYLTRKKEKSPLYAKVPEATFLRTYVREDMVKCLCFYDAEDDGAVLKAREAVGAPIDRFHHLDQR